MSESVNQPTEYSLTYLAKFIEAFNNGYNATEASDFAGVSRQTYYDWCKKYPDFKEKTDAAKTAITRRAKEVIIKLIKDGDAAMARWYLEKRDPDFRKDSKTEADQMFKIGW